MNNTTKKLLIAAGLIIAGIALGWLLFGGSNGSEGNHDQDAEQTAAETIWTCSMHPQIRQNEPGLCPICGMDLIPLEPGSGGQEPGAIEMTEAAVALANIQTMRVARGSAEKQILLNGKVVPDERNVAEITARFGGRIEQLYVNVTGQYVRKGEKLAAIYSPALIAAQQELLEARKLKESTPSLYQAARRKLALWNITDAQIDAFEKSETPQTSLDIRSPMSGTVLGRHVDRGDYVTEGRPMFEIAGLDRVWVMFEAYEGDLAWIKKGNAVTFTVQSEPGKTFRGKVTFIDPVMDAVRRVAYVRTEVGNPGGILKPGMFARGELQVRIGAGTSEIMVPKSAVLWTGERSVVYVKDASSDVPRFEFREVVLGPTTGDAYVIRSGIAEGEEIVTNGVFAVDAAAQLQGKTSMMSGGRDVGASNKQQDIPTGFSNALAPVYDGYLKIKDALVQTNATKAADAATAFLRAIGDVNSTTLGGDLRSDWNASKKAMTSAATALAKQQDVEKQRASFSKLSGSVYTAVKAFGHTRRQPLYYQHCPMAFDDEGAYWLSADKQIANPYFGDKMMKCGSTKETIKN